MDTENLKKESLFALSTLTPEKAFKRTAWAFGLLLVAWPISGFSVFALDDPNVHIVWNVLRHYLVFSCLLYPAFYIAGIYFSRKAYKNGAPAKKVLKLGLIPLLSGTPWFLLFIPVLFIFF